MKSMDELMEKVEKLLALAGNNTSEDEAKQAALMAQKLIAKYNLDMSKSTAQEEKMVLLPATHPNNNGYRGHLAPIVGQNFRCKAIYVGSQIHFFGLEADCKTCVEVFNYLYTVIRKNTCHREYVARKAGTFVKGMSASYQQGFLVGLRDALAIQSKALMVVTPESVEREFAERFCGAKPNKRAGMRYKGVDMDSYQAGYKDGKSSMTPRTLQA